MHHALPVFVDTDPETFQIDARKIEAAITERTACIMPVHLGGSAADMDTILAVAAKHKLPVVEDACQAHLAEWRTKKVSTLGDLGCFSFQASKNLNSGEGGAILTNSDELYEQCKSFQNNGRAAANAGFCIRPQRRQPADDRVPGRALVAAAHPARRAVAPPRAKRGLSHRASPARSPASRPPGCTTAARAMPITSTCFGMIAAHFEGLPGPGSSRPCSAEGIPVSGGYQPLYQRAVPEETRSSRGPFRRSTRPSGSPSTSSRSTARPTTGSARPAVWLMQTTLLGPTLRHGPDRRGRAEGAEECRQACVMS